jgi:ribonuclease III
MSDKWGALEGLLGHRFRDRSLLEQAFVHDSYLHENRDTATASNERLEFLGDAWLDYVVAEELFRRFPEAPEGELTKMRAVAVQTPALAEVARTLKLADHLSLGRGEDQTGGRDRASNLAGLYEAVVGALLTDGGERPARKFVLRTLGEHLKRGPAGSTDFKSALQEYCQARRWEAPSYRLVSSEGPPHARHFTVEVSVRDEVQGWGEGSNRREAEKEAARQALDRLGA